MNLPLINISFSAMGKSENNIGIFGGTFDPIHNGHLIIAQLAAEEVGLEKVIFIPNKIPPHREEPFASPASRYEMVKLSISDNPLFEISDSELKKGERSYSVETIRELKTIYPDKTIFLIIGGDTYPELSTWKDIGKLSEMVTFLVAPRKGFKWGRGSFIPRPHLIKAKFLHTPYLEISGSQIRERVRESKSIRYLVPEKVEEYIISRRLYLTNKSQ